MKKYLLAILLFCSIFSFADYQSNVVTPNGSTVVAYVTDEASASTNAYFDSEFAQSYPNATQIQSYGGYSSSRKFNCHGYAWYMSEFSNHLNDPRWIGYSANNTDEHIYWNDGSYVEVSHPVYPGKVSWASGDHSAITSQEPGWYVSKWNQYPLMRHRWNDSPFGNTNLKYYQRATAFQVNDNYIGATSLTPNNPPLFGSTKGATLSPQARPSSYLPSHYVMTQDVWYKFVASSSNQTMNITNESLFGYDYGTPYVATALYDSSLNLLNSFSNNTATFTNLTIGQIYYIRCWAGNANVQKTMDFNISLLANGTNVINGISITGSSLTYTLTTSYSINPSIPSSDITFEWAVYPGEVEPATDYSITQGAGPHQINIVAGPNEGDTTVRAKVRMKRISTGEVLTDWYAYSALIWFG